MATKKTAPKTEAAAAAPAPKRKTPQKTEAKPKATRKRATQAAPKTEKRRPKRERPDGLQSEVLDDETAPTWAQGLMPSERVFVDAYIRHYNASKAYREAHPESSEQAASVNAHRVLRRDRVKSAIKAALKQTLLSNEELEARIVDQITHSINDYIIVRNGVPEVDWAKAKEEGALRHLRKFTITPTKHGDRITFETKDDQRAIDMLIKLRGLEKRTVELTGKDGAPIQTVATLPSADHLKQMSKDEAAQLFNAYMGITVEDGGDE